MHRDTQTSIHGDRQTGKQTHTLMCTWSLMDKETNHGTDTQVKK